MGHPAGEAAHRPRMSSASIGALATLLCLGGPPMVVLALQLLIVSRFPAFAARFQLNALMLLVILAIASWLGGAAFGVVAARIRGVPAAPVRRRAARTWGISMPVAFVVLFVGDIAAQVAFGYPSRYLVFAVMFAVTIGVLVLVMGRALARPADWAGRPWALGAPAAAAAVVAFVAVDAVMHLAGWRVGGLNADRRATMLTVTLLGVIAAALAGGAALGARLHGVTPVRAD